MAPEFAHPDPALLDALALAARAEAKQRRQLLGWWLPAAAAVLLGAPGAVLGFAWPFWLVVFGMLSIFHRYHRWKLALAFAVPPRWCFGYLGDTRQLTRGQRQSHGLMHPVHLKQLVRWEIPCARSPLGERKELVFWIDGGLLRQLDEGQFVGLLQVGEEGVLAACRREQLFLASALRLDEELAVQVAQTKTVFVSRTESGS